MARSTFYYTLSVKDKADKYKDIKEKIKKVDELYGYRRVTVELQNQGIRINHKTVLKLRYELGLQCLVRQRKHAHKQGHESFVAPNLLKQNFVSDSPLEKLVTDVTEFAVCGKKVYLSPVLDLFNKEIIGYSIAQRANTEMVLQMMKQVIPKLPKGKQIILHSDQGSLYKSHLYRDLLGQLEITQSMSRKGNCFDNAVIENFFGHLKTEFFYLRTFNSVEEFIKGLKQYIHYYNYKRIKLKLGGLSPVQYRIKLGV